MLTVKRILRARRVRKHCRDLDDAAHIAWAQELLSQPMFTEDTVSYRVEVG